MASTINLNNYTTASQGRVGSTKDVSTTEMETRLADAKSILTKDTTYAWDANINGIIVRLVTNSKHQYNFWVQNWWPGPNNDTVLPHATIYSVSGIKNGGKLADAHAYYCPSRHTALFQNTEYYGQCKSWALGIAAHILEVNFNVHSIHGACAEVNGKGVVVVAPTGTGKTTQVNKLFQHAQGRVIGDDWIYIKHPENIEKIASPILEVTQPEKSLYVRTENAKEEGWLAPVFDRCMLENVQDEAGVPVNQRADGDTSPYYAFGNSRAMLPREWMAGPEKVGDKTTMRLIVLLRRDNESPAEISLNADEAIAILKEGKTLIRPGAGPKEKWGTYGYEPWYNPYLLAPDHKRQEKFFRDEMKAARVVIINTGAPGESIERTYQRIMHHLEKA